MELVASSEEAHPSPTDSCDGLPEGSSTVAAPPYAFAFLIGIGTIGESFALFPASRTNFSIAIVVRGLGDTVVYGTLIRSSKSSHVGSSQASFEFRIVRAPLRRPIIPACKLGLISDVQSGAQAGEEDSGECFHLVSHLVEVLF